MFTRNRSSYIACLERDVPSSRCFQLLLLMSVISEADCIHFGRAHKTSPESSVTCIGSDVPTQKKNVRNVSSRVGKVVYGHYSGQLGTPAPAITSLARTQSTSDQSLLQFTKYSMYRRLNGGDWDKDAQRWGRSWRRFAKWSTKLAGRMASGRILTYLLTYRVSEKDCTFCKKISLGPWCDIRILRPREQRVFQSKLGVSSSNQCNLHHSPHTGHLGTKKIKKGTIFFGHPVLTYSMQQSPSWGANRFSASQEIPRTVWNPKVHHRFNNCPPTVPILSQLDPVQYSHIPLPEHPS
jgi:hypothetical protein